MKSTVEASQTEVALLRFEQVSFADVAAKTDFQSRNIHLVLCGANARVTHRLRRMGILIGWVPTGSSLICKSDGTIA